MNITGTNTIHATPQQVWDAFHDTQVLAKCIPGVQELVLESEDSYKAKLALAVGPVKGVFQGKVKFSDKTEPENITLTLEAKSPVGIVNAVGQLNIKAATLPDGTSGTELTWSGAPKLAGMLATLGARLMEGVAKQQADAFFSKLEQELQA